MQYSLRDIIKEFRETTVQKNKQYTGGKDEEATYKISFGDVTINQFPRLHEGDNSYKPILPHTARIRGITYQTEIFFAVKIIKTLYGDSDEVKSVQTLYEDERVPMGKIPVMVRSKYCHLSTLTKEEIVKNARECRYDQGGYFIINGNEKVLVA